MVENDILNLKDLEKMTGNEQLKSSSNDFGWALQQMKDGKMVWRSTIWISTCIFLIKGRTIEYNTFQNFENNACQAFKPPQDIIIKDHIDVKNAQGEYITGWIPSQEDMLAEDWEIYK